MRMKFEKGAVPERIAKAFVDYIRENEIVIGAVNIYVQVYDDEMKAEKFMENGEYLRFQPTATMEKEYLEDVAAIRRQKMKAVV